MIGWRLTVVQAGGGLKDRAAIQWRDEYHKRFRRFGQMTLVEKKFKPDQDVFAGYGQAFKVILDEHGKQTDSPGLAKWLGDWTARHGHIVFAIGDAYGHSAATKQSADVTWSLSSLVLPHQLAHVLVVEQLYRAATIAAGLPYHHA